MTIAVLEDHAAIVEQIEDTQEMQGHQVTACSCGQELLYVLLASKSVEHDTTAPYDLLIVDDLLTGVMNGGMVIATIRRWYPAEMLPILFISGANPVDLAKVQTLFSVIVGLQKSFAIKALLVLIDQATTNLARQ